MTTHERLDAPFRISPGITLRARPGYIVYMNGEWSDVRLPEGRFSSNLYRVVGETPFTPFVALVNNVQVRHGQPCHGVAITFQMDSQAWQRPLCRLYPQLAGGLAGGPICQPGQQSFL